MQIVTTAAHTDIENPSMCLTKGTRIASGTRSGTNKDVNAIVNNRNASGTSLTAGQKALFFHFVSFHIKNAPGQTDSPSIMSRSIKPVDVNTNCPFLLSIVRPKGRVNELHEFELLASRAQAYAK